MNEIYLQRWVTSALMESVQENPVTVVTGARQVGKSTLLEHRFTAPKWRYLSLDDLDILGQAKADPMALLADPSPLIIDEVQRAPDMLLAVKRVVDRERRSRRLILSGSANLLLMQKVGESLAGRAVYCHLEPFTWGECLGLKPRNLLPSLFSGEKLPADLHTRPEEQADLKIRIYEGWMPVVALEKKEGFAARWLEGYVLSYLERDLRQLSQIDSLTDFRRLMSALALRSGHLLNQMEIGRDIGMKQPTVHRYINLLETSHLFHRLPAYSVNRTKRLMKTPKPYFLDSGLAAFLAGALHRGSEEAFSFLGPLFETTVFHHLRVWSGLQHPQGRLFYWRTLEGSEVDFVLEWGKKLLAFEVKAKDRPQFSDAESLRLFMSEYPETRAGVVAHLGDRIEQLGEKIYAIPFALLF